MLAFIASNSMILGCIQSSKEGEVFVSSITLGKGNYMIEWLNNNQGFVMAVLTAVYVFATFIIAIMAKRSNDLARRNIDTLTKLEKERLKPAIVAEILADIPFFTVRVSNKGQTTALDVRFELEPKLRMVLGGANAIPKEKAERPIGFMENGIASLPPGSTLSSLIGTFNRIKEVCPGLVFRGKVTYRDREGTRYEDEVVLDARHHEDSLHLDRKTIHDVAKRLEEIKREINHLATGFHKPHVLTQDIKEQRAEMEEFVRQAQEKKSPNKAPEATSEPAPGADSSAPQG
jgi:hypothetical protein